MYLYFHYILKGNRGTHITHIADVMDKLRSFIRGTENTLITPCEWAYFVFFIFSSRILYFQAGVIVNRLVRLVFENHVIMVLSLKIT